MGIKNLMFNDIEIAKNEFHRYKNPIFLNAAKKRHPRCSKYVLNTE